MLKKYNDLLKLEETQCKELFEQVDHPWEVFPKIKEYIPNLIGKLSTDYYEYKKDVWVHNTSVIADSACIVGPCVIGKNTEVRHCAYIRGNVVVGDNCVIGNSTEVKNAIIFNNAKCPHYNYVGDSILGSYAHTGAGVILSNMKSDESNITLKIDGEKIETGLRKFGAILGSHVEVGCGSVICPGSIVYPNTNIYPLTMVRGIIGSNKIVKDMKNIIDKEER